LRHCLDSLAEAGWAFPSVLMGEDSVVKSVSQGWRFVSIGWEGDATDVGGLNPWDVKWTHTDRRITVAHPSYPSQRHTLFINQVAGSSPPITFAAGELSTPGQN
jgi:hypothetical protein